MKQFLSEMNINTGSSNYSARTFENVTGVILAGGKSSRFGRNKALEKIDGMTLIERVCSIFSSVFPQLLVVTNSPDEYVFLNIPITGDIIQGLGPIGGIYSGLCSMKTQAGFFVACDMPYLNRDLICYMTDISGGYDAVVPKIDWMLEPLHALYTRKCIPEIGTEIESHKRQIINCFSRFNVRYVYEDEIRMFDPEVRSFLNINNPGDIAKMQHPRYLHYES